MRFETWVERQIREAQERGEFDDLPGAGQPLPGLTGQYDELWWVKRVAEREHLSLLPPMLALRYVDEEFLDDLRGAMSAKRLCSSACAQRSTGDASCGCSAASLA